MKAKAALVISWGAGSVDGVSDADVKAKLTSAIAPFAVPPLLARYVEGTFDFAFVNHAPMEVGSAVADVRSNSAEVWLATKSPTGAQSAVAGAVGLQTGPGDGARGPRRRFVRPADLLRPGRRGRSGVQGDRPAGEADVDPQRRHAARPDASAQPSPDPGHLRGQRRAQLRAPHVQRRGRLHRQRHRPGAGRRGLRQPDGRDRILPAQRGLPVQLRRGDRDAHRGALRPAHRNLAVDVLRAGAHRRRDHGRRVGPQHGQRPGRVPAGVLQDRRRTGGAEQGRLGRQLGTADGTTAPRRASASTPSTGRWSRASSKSTAPRRHRG